MSSLWYELSFREPRWLLLAAQPLLIMLLSRLLASRRTQRYSDRRLRPWSLGRSAAVTPLDYVRPVLLFVAWLLLAAAIAGPRLPQAVPDNQSTPLRQVMVLLDVSPSMSARDVSPTRLERAKLELLDLINRMQATRLGIVVYGARAHLLSPPTYDKQVLRDYVAAVNNHLLPTLGSRLTRALRFAAQQFFPSDKTPRALLIISDGEYQNDSTAQQAELETTVQQLRQQGIRLYALGVGTAYGAPVLAADKGWLTYQGQTVTSRLQAAQLQRLTRLGNGRYSEIHDSGADWQQLYDEGIARLKPAGLKQQAESNHWRELYPWCVLPALVLFMLALWQPRRSRHSASLFVIALVLVLLTPANDSLAATVTYKTAYENLQAKHYQLAKQQFSHLAGYAARLGEGSAAYQLQDYKSAAQQFTQAMLDAANDQQRGRALFNLANCQYQLQDYQIAAQLYRDVLRYLPQHRGARINLEYALALQSDSQAPTKQVRRPGAGAETGRLPKGQATQTSRLSLGDNNDKPQTLPPPVPTNTNRRPAKQTWHEAQPASSRVDRQTDAAWDYRISSIEQLQQENLTVESIPGQFWQRLFEQEEGFMAPQQQARRLPEVKPW